MKKNDSTLDLIYHMQSKEFRDLCGIKRKALLYYMENDCVEYQTSDSNNYHIFDNESFYSVCQIKMLNSIGFTFKQISKLSYMEPTEIVTSYKQKAEEITEKINSMGIALDIINRRISLVEKTQNFHTNVETSIKEFPYKYIYPQDLTNNTIVSNCKASKMSYATLIPLQHPMANPDENTDIAVTVPNNIDNTQHSKNFSLGGYATNDICDALPLWTKDPSSRFIHTVNSQGKRTKQDTNSVILLPTTIINDAVLAVAPNKKAAAAFTQAEQPITYSQLISILSSLGFKIKNSIFIWIINATVNGIRQDYFDFYIEY